METKSKLYYYVCKGCEYKIPFNKSNGFGKKTTIESLTKDIKDYRTLINDAKTNIKDWELAVKILKENKKNWNKK